MLDLMHVQAPLLQKVVTPLMAPEVQATASHEDGDGKGGSQSLLSRCNIKLEEYAVSIQDDIVFPLQASRTFQPQSLQWLRATVMQC